MSRRNTRRAKALLSLLATLTFALLAIAGAELCLRVSYGRIERITGVTAWRVDEWHGLRYHWDAYHPKLGWTNLPGYRSDARIPFEVTINSQGLRGAREYAAHPPRGVRRIAVFGDSFTFGEEVDDDETVPHYLERLLGATEVLNFGVRGYGLGQMALRLEEDGFRCEPDQVVVIALLPEDPGRDPLPTFAHPKPVFYLRDGTLEIGNTPVPIATEEPWILRNVFTAAWLWGRPPTWPPTRTVAETLAVAEKIVDRMARACRARGIDFTLVLITTAGTLRRPPEGRLRRIVDAMRRHLAARGVPTIDLVADLERALRREGRALVAPLAHWSARGNRLIAQRIAGRLTDASTAR